MPAKKIAKRKPRVSKGVKQTQDVKQTVRVVIGDVSKLKDKKKREPSSKKKKEVIYIPFGGGGGEGTMPFTPTPFPSSSTTTYYPVNQYRPSPVLEDRIRRLEYKGDNPPLEVSGAIANTMIKRLEDKSNLSNEPIEQVIEEEEKNIIGSSTSIKDFDTEVKNLIQQGYSQAQAEQKAKRSESARKAAATRKAKKRELDIEYVQFDEDEVKLETPRKNKKITEYFKKTVPTKQATPSKPTLPKAVPTKPKFTENAQMFKQDTAPRSVKPGVLKLPLGSKK